MADCRHPVPEGCHDDRPSVSNGVERGAAFPRQRDGCLVVRGLFSVAEIAQAVLEAERDHDCEFHARLEDCYAAHGKHSTDLR
jgi:hypothetical protein